MSEPSNEAPAPPRRKPRPAPPGATGDIGMPRELWSLGVGFSLFLILAGMAVIALNGQLYAIGALAVCIGFGIALAAFGTRVGGRFLKFNIVGGGAMAVALYLLLYYFSLPSLVASNNYLLGEIYDTGQLKNVRGRAKQVFLTGRTGENGDFRFIVFQNEIGDGLVRFNFDFPEGGPQKEFFINCISSEDLKAAMGRRETLSLSLEESDGKFRLIETSSGREMGKLNEQNCSAPVSEPSVSDEVGFLDRFSLAAYAQEPDGAVAKSLTLLESEDGDQRDRARDYLASRRSAEDLRAMTGQWDIATSSYRADLGRLVAWSAAIGKERTAAVTLAKALTPDQVRYLVQLTGQGDITMRQFATEILHRLLETTSWPNGPTPTRADEIVDATLAALASPGPDPLEKTDVQFSAGNRLYNAVVAIGFTQCNMGATYRQRFMQSLAKLSGRLEAAGNSPKTVARIRKVMGDLKTCA